MTDLSEATPAAASHDSDRSELVTELARVLDVVGHMNGSESLAETLQAVAEGIVMATGFSTVLINYMRSDGLLEVTTVVGPAPIREKLLGQVFPPGDLVDEMDAAESWGRLRYGRHDRPAKDYEWIPDLPVPADPRRWSPYDSLLVPLFSTTDEMIGVLSVDMPTNGLLPNADQRQLLTLLATQAEIAINNARLTQQLKASEASLRLAFDAATVGMAVVSLDQRTPQQIVRGNPALAQLAHRLGRAPLSALHDLLDRDDERHDEALLWLMTLPETGPTRVEMRVMNGLDERWLEISGSELPRHSTQAPQAIVQIEDITERRLAELEVRRAAARDPLTGLSNRTELMQRLTQLCVTSRETQTTGAVLFCDLDGFKAINDTFGHPAGDTALIACAARLAALVRGTDRAYRVGGDEFVILLADVSSWTVEEIVGRVKASVAAPLTHDGEHLRLSLSVGWAAIDGRTVDVARILAAADAAMYADKRAHRPAHRS